MDRYKSLQTEEDNSYISPFTVGHMMEEAKRDPRFVPSPSNPNPGSIPSAFDYKSWKILGSRNEPVASQPPQQIIYRDRTYGPSSSSHASLRFYGTGPY